MKRASAAVALALFALASCRQIVGLDDRDATHDAGADVEVSTGDAQPVPSEAGCDADFCDDFDDPTRDAGWIVAIDHEDGGGAAPLVGEVFIDPSGGRTQAGLRAKEHAFSTDGFRNCRWVRSFATSASFAELTFSLFVPDVAFSAGSVDVQLALLNIPGALVYPQLTAGKGLVFQFTSTDGGYELRDSIVGLTANTWVTIKLSIDRDQKRVRAFVGDKIALDEAYENNGNIGTFDIAMGVRHNFGNVPEIDVRYDDVVLRFR